MTYAGSVTGIEREINRDRSRVLTYTFHAVDCDISHHIFTSFAQRKSWLIHSCMHMFF